MNRKVKRRVVDGELLLDLGKRGVYSQWVFQQGDNRISVSVKGDRSSNDAEVVRRWAVAGLGLANKSVLDMSQDLLQRRVRPTLLDGPKPESDLLESPAGFTGRIAVAGFSARQVRTGAGGCGRPRRAGARQLMFERSSATGSLTRCIQILRWCTRAITQMC